MAGEYTTRVNQALAFAKALNTQAAQEQQASILAKACLEGACLQLHIAYNFYLREIAAQYSLPVLTHGSAEELQTIFAEQGRICPEVTELCEIHSRSGSWLSCLRGAHQRILDPDGPTSSSSVSAHPSTLNKDRDHSLLIGVVEVDIQVLSTGNVKEWLGSISTLITRHRESMQEC